MNSATLIIISWNTADPTLARASPPKLRRENRNQTNRGGGIIGTERTRSKRPTATATFSNANTSVADRRPRVRNSTNSIIRAVKAAPML